MTSGDTINSFKAAKPVFRAGINYQLAEATYLRTLGAKDIDSKYCRTIY